MPASSIPARIDGTGSSRIRRLLWLHEQMSGWGFLLPALSVVGIFTLIPIGFSLWLSFYRWDMMRPNRSFLGLANFQRLLGDDRFFLNSLFVSSAATIGTVITSALAGYAFSHIRFAGRGAIFAVLVATMAIPGEVTIVPSFLIMRELGWIDSYYALIVPSLAGVFGIFLMRQTFARMPRDLFEAARLDGCGHLRYLIGIVVPLNVAALASLALLTFLAQWNAYLWPLLVTNRTEMRTVQVGIRYFVDTELGNQWGALMAASTFVVLPTLIAFLLAQRFLVKGFAFAGIKG